MAKITVEQIAAAKALLKAASQERGEEKYNNGWQYKEALEYLCSNVIGMKLADIFTAAKLRYQLADGSYWYGIGKWPPDMAARVTALRTADPKLSLIDARSQVKWEFNKDRPPAQNLTDEQKAQAAAAKQEEVVRLAQELAQHFAEFFEPEEQGEIEQVAPPLEPAEPRQAEQLAAPHVARVHRRAGRALNVNAPH